MCGIAGFVLDEINPSAADWLSTMTQSLYHRGPDDGGAVAFGMNGDPVAKRTLGRPDEKVDWGYVPVKIGLGARRLAVVDPSPSGHQPMSSPDDRVWIVYNGEIYNHAKLRDELRAGGMQFEGHSDTEVLLAAYRAWGCECFDRLDGMWAVAIVDWLAGRLVLSRDRLGIKPLHISRFDGGLAFASEIKSLLTLPGAAHGVNEARLRDFLCDGMIDHTGDTLFAGIWSAPAGCWVELDVRARGVMHAGGAVRRYWRPHLSWSDVPDASRGVAESLSESIAAHVHADVPIGSCLSGGVDSSAIVSLVHHLLKDNAGSHPNLTQHTFTASLPGCELDETMYAKAVVETRPGLQWHLIQPTPQRLLEQMSALMWHQEQPFGSPSIYMQWEVMRLAKETGVTVLLDGQGGDELFCGYEGYVPPYLAHLLRHGRFQTLWREYRAARANLFAGGGLMKHVVAALLPDDLRDHLRMRNHPRHRPWLATDLFSPDPSPGMCETLGLSPAEQYEETSHVPALMKRLWSLLRHESLPALLRFEDRNSMAFSIEARVPYLSRQLVELGMRLPMRDKIKKGVLKAVLREALRGVVPDVVLDRRDKIGFSAPTAGWMRGALRDWWQEAVTSRSFLDRGCFRAKGVVQLIRRFDAGDTSAADHLWRLAIVEQWARQFLDG